MPVDERFGNLAFPERHFRCSILSNYRSGEAAVAYYRKMIGERVYLGPMCPEDAPLYTEWLNNPELARNLNIAARNISEVGEEQWLRENMDRHTYRIGMLEDDRTIGNVGFENLDHFNASAEIGIFVGPDEYQGKGYGTEAMALAMGYAFVIHNLESIMLRLFPWNARARAAYRKLGFSDAGVLRKAIRRYGRSWDEILMDITAEEFLSGPWSRFAPEAPDPSE